MHKFFPKEKEHFLKMIMIVANSLFRKQMLTYGYKYKTYKNLKRPLN